MTAVVLVGPMGAGKTSIGKKLAKALGVGFVDTDQAIVREHGAISGIFADHGEDHFRRLEERAVAHAVAQGGVVALGGGAVLSAATRELLQDHRVVLLTVDARVMATRVANSNRPLLAGAADPTEQWVKIFEERRPLYEQTAQFTLDTSKGKISDLVAVLASWAQEGAS